MPEYFAKRMKHEVVKIARAPNKKIEKAKELYLNGKRLVDIAGELGVPEGTVRRWKSTHKWDGERSNKKSERSEKKKDEEKKEVADEVGRVMENPELTDKQRLFCVLYIRCFNATKAYKKAYGCSYETAMTEGCNLLRNPKIQNTIKELKQARLNREMLDVHDIFQKYMDIAFADITDYLEFGQQEVPVMAMYGPVMVKDPETGEQKQMTKIVNTVRFRESDQVDGTIISEVKQGKDGASIKLADRMKALQWLSDHMDLATEEQRAKIEAWKAKSQKQEEKQIEVTFVKAGERDGKNTDGSK